jgi:thymidylate synthase (FAD)
LSFCIPGMIQHKIGKKDQWVKPMRIVEQTHRIVGASSWAEKLIEEAGRTCYKSEDQMTEDSAPRFINMVKKRGHDSVLEHASASVRFITDRGVTHEIVRHRLAAYSQESTRYCDYGGDHLQFIRPVWVPLEILGEYDIAWDGIVGMTEYHEKDCLITEGPAKTWFWNMAVAERDYKRLLKKGWRAEQARSVLPNSLKTEIVMTCNFREWLHVFKLRAVGTTGKPHPQMQKLMLLVLYEFGISWPAVFGDLAQYAIGKQIGVDIHE